MKHKLIFKIWKTSLVPKVVLQPKLHEDSVIKIIDLAMVEEMIKIILRKDVAMLRVDPIKIVRSSIGVYEVGSLPTLMLTSIEIVCVVADVIPFSTLMAADVIPHNYPEAEDDELVGDVPLPGEKDAQYAVLTALEDLNV